MCNKLRLFSVGLLLGLSFFLGGCQTPKVCDARGPSEMCEIHHQFMETEVIDNKKHWPMPSQEYLEARAKYFRHAYPFILPEKCDKVAVFICPDCVRAEQEWKRRNKQ